MGWMMIASGLALVAFGLYLWRSDAWLGIGIMVFGLFDTVAGAVMLHLAARHQRNTKEKR
jgi:hypothetical protein